MEFQVDDQQRMIAQLARDLGQNFGPDYWRDLDARKQFPRELWTAVADAGLAGTAISEAFGGSGLGMMEMAMVIEEIAAAGGGATVGQLFMIGPIFGGYAVQRFGSDDMKRSLLPRIAGGEIIALALTEPNAGSNSLKIDTFAEAAGQGWRLNGRKIWITGLESASKVVVVARTTKRADASSRTQGISLFMVDVDRQGLTYNSIEKAGTNTLSASAVFFDDVIVQSDELIGVAGEGWRHLLDILNPERIATTAALVGAGTLAMRLGIDYANERRLYDDRPISSYQGLQFPLAHAYMELEAARLLNYKAAWLFDNGRTSGAEANAGKFIAARAAELATDRAMQMMGGMGYAKESHVERLWRDTRLFRIAPVPEEMILNFIAQHNLGMPRSY